MGCRGDHHRNGAPWGNGPGQPFTPLGVFLIDQGIRIAHARPYHPQTMGKDERFHRTLKLEAMGGPPFADAPAAQKVFERWRAIYNHERPHEALDLRPPASRYQPSPRSYAKRRAHRLCPARPGPHRSGWRTISFKGLTRRVPHAFKGRPVALRPSQADGCYDVFYRHQKIATLDFSNQQRQPQPVHHVSEQVSTISPV